MNKLRILATLSVALCLASCFRLDDQLYNNENSIDAYLFDGFTGTSDFRLGSAYDIADSNRYLFQLTSDDNGNQARIWALYVGDTSQIRTDTVILYCHGNRFHMDSYWQRVKLLAHTGGKHHYGVLTLDYRGFGLSGGKPTESGMYADVQAVLAWAKSKGLTGDRLVMYGFSLGSAPATELTAFPRELTPSKLILEAPFASTAVMVQDAALLNLPSSFFTNTLVDNAAKIPSVSQPFLWIHGTADDFLDYTTHGKTVYDRYAGVYKEHLRVEGAGHSDIEEVVGFDPYLQRLDAFIRY